MLKKKNLTMTFMMFMLLVVVGCSNNATSIVEEKEQEIMELEKIVEDSNKMLVESKDIESILTEELEEAVVIADEATSEVDALKAQNEELIMSLEDSKAKLMDIDIIADPIPLAISPYPGMSVLVAATNVLDAMRTNDYVTLASYVDPIDGVYVAPFQYIDFSLTYIFTASQIENLATIPTVYPWGNHPSSGDLISLNLMDYYNEYMYDEDYYLAPIVGMNIVVSSGNMINNIAASFPGTDTVEFLFPEFDPSYGGLDWSSITLVFDSASGMPMLYAIVHGEWTP